jgi:hypothetical protein
VSHTPNTTMMRYFAWLSLSSVPRCQRVSTPADAMALVSGGSDDRIATSTARSPPDDKAAEVDPRWPMRRCVREQVDRARRSRYPCRDGGSQQSWMNTPKRPCSTTVCGARTCAGMELGDAARQRGRSDAAAQQL